jgi:hypothetical protein
MAEEKWSKKIWPKKKFLVFGRIYKSPNLIKVNVQMAEIGQIQLD